MKYVDCELCLLADGKEGFIVTFCNNHPTQVLVVSRTHKPQFTEAEKEKIKRMFPGGEIHWEKRKI